MHVAGTGDVEYLAKTQAALKQAFQEFKPDIVLYNAGEQRPARRRECAMHIHLTDHCRSNALVLEATGP
jgi:acetoin utilization deacetylase AcuC-like enzyme